jgi:alkylation response protein AidB-like acyl-CoA dehydrogenase
MAKLVATENAQTVIDAAVQMFDGRGVKVGETVASLYREISRTADLLGRYRSAKTDRGARTSQAPLSDVNIPSHGVAAFAN